MKRLVSLILSFTFILALAPSTFAASDEAIAAANALYELGLFSGTGIDANGNPNFDLDRIPTRHEAVTMLVRLLGKEEEAVQGTWNMPFTDVADWAKPYVGYAYANNLTSGTSTTTYNGNEAVSASQYLTFALRALGYESGIDFQWDKAWELSDKIGLTDGRYNANTANFTRGDVAIISNNSLAIPKKQEDKSGLTPESLQGIWYNGEKNSVSDETEYIFEGNSVIRVDYQRSNSIYVNGKNVPWLFLSYMSGTYTIDGNKILISYDYEKGHNIREWYDHEIESTSHWHSVEYSISYSSAENSITISNTRYQKQNSAKVLPFVEQEILNHTQTAEKSLITAKDANQIIANLKKIGEFATSSANSLLEARSCVIKVAGTTGRAQELMALAANTAFAEVLLDESESVKLFDNMIQICNKYDNEKIKLLGQKFEVAKNLCQEKVDILTTLCRLDITISAGHTTATNLLNQVTSLTAQETTVVNEIVNIIGTISVS